MRVHLTCRRPTRALFVRLRTARELLARDGNLVTSTWPGSVLAGGGDELDGQALQTAHVIVHACTEDEAGLPAEVEAALARGTPVIRMQTGGAADLDTSGATLCVTALEELVPALGRVAALSIAC